MTRPPGNEGEAGERSCLPTPPSPALSPSPCFAPECPDDRPGNPGGNLYRQGQGRSGRTRGVPTLDRRCEVRTAALGEAVTRLPWLSPCASSLVALTRPADGGSWEQVRQDPGCVLLLVRQAGSALASPVLSFWTALLHQPAVLEGALPFLELPASGFVDWNQPTTQPIYQASLTLARGAAILAERSGRCDPDNAWVAGLLAPLGWLAVCAVDADRAAAVRAQLTAMGRGARAASAVRELQSRTWGLDQAGIARRLARRWNLPPWLTAIVGHLSLTAEQAEGLGADRDLFRLVQLAVGLAQRQEVGLALATGAAIEETAAALELSAADLDAVQELVGRPRQSSPVSWRPPASIPLLRDLVRLAAENRRLARVSILDRLDADLDHLHSILDEQRASEAERLRTQKLRALAEFAAGAGHEINNPLAVISGQAQYLLKRLRLADCGLPIDELTAGSAPNQQDEESPVPPLPQAEICNSLQTIVKQAQRIHELLNELRQFARPPQPQKQLVNLAALVREVVAGLSELAAQRKVRLVCPEDHVPLSLWADPRQLRTILSCLLRNAIEAAPEDGWASICLEPGAERLRVVVADSGPGPTPAQREHLFDPFYSGRLAGRGRGLGLSTAWRLAQAHDGDVYLDDRGDGPTRFVLSLPMPPVASTDPAREAG